MRYGVKAHGNNATVRVKTKKAVKGGQKEKQGKGVIYQIRKRKLSVCRGQVSEEGE